MLTELRVSLLRVLKTVGELVASGLDKGEIVVTAAKQCVDMLYRKNSSSKLVTKYHV